MPNAKQIAAEKAVEEIREGMVIGLGTGSTSAFAIARIGERVRAGLGIEAVCTSRQTERLARDAGIPIRPFDTIRQIDLSIDGADQVDRYRNLIKGGGGSLLREKIVEHNSNAFYVVVDESKLVDTFEGFPLPVEVIPFAATLTLAQIRKLHCTPRIRQTGAGVFTTDNGNLIADCEFGPINDPRDLHRRLKEVPGVVETGLFMHELVTKVFVGYSSGRVETI